MLDFKTSLILKIISSLFFLLSGIRVFLTNFLVSVVFMLIPVWWTNLAHLVRLQLFSLYGATEPVSRSRSRH